MKKTFTYSTVLFCTVVLLLSCSKNAKDDFSQPTSAITDRIINAKVAPGQTYTLSIANSGEVSIYKQAAHYLVSETGIDENGSIIYKYSPASGFTGIDEVLLSHRTEISINNNGCIYDSGADEMRSHATSIAVKITVAD